MSTVAPLPRPPAAPPPLGAPPPAEDQERPLVAYATLATLFASAFGGSLLLAARRGALPERLGASDIALVSLGTFKLSRVLTKDAVAGFLRAPFVEYEGLEGVSKPKERPRGNGLRRAAGQLLLCPDCTGMWVGASLTAALLAAPRTTRLACATLSAVAGADFLQNAYRATH